MRNLSLMHSGFCGLTGTCIIALGLLGQGGASAAPVAKKPITITPAGAPTIKKAIAAKKGHVVVVNFWATWCPPCVAEFPALVKLQHQYRSKGLVVFTVSANLIQDKDSKVKPFLAKQGADFPQFLLQSVDPADLINAFDPTWQGDIPRTFIYDKHGRLAKVLSGEQTQKSFKAAVEPLLK